MRRAIPVVVATCVGLGVLVRYQTNPTPVAPVVTELPSVPEPTISGSSTTVETTDTTEPTEPTTTNPSDNASCISTSGGDVVVNGPSLENPYGPVQVQVHLTNGQIVDVQALKTPDDLVKSRRINYFAAPELRSMVLAAQSAQIDTVSGATYTSDSYRQWFARVDALFSTWRPDSEIVRLAVGDLSVDDASGEVREVLDLCEWARRETDGGFDIAARAHEPEPRPDGSCALDPSGFVKGWALERAAAALTASGARNFCINAGGDVVVRGVTDAGPWRIGVQHPWERDRVAMTLAVTDAAVATSGRYERGDHIVDPQTGQPASGLMSVSIVGPDLGIADAFATGALAVGRDGLSWLASRSDVEWVAITDDAELFASDGLDRYRVA
jgi:thiamine biosynthesis lipoprotein